MSNPVKFKVLTLDKSAYEKIRWLADKENSTLSYIADEIIKNCKFKDLSKDYFELPWRPYRRLALNLSEDSFISIKMLSRAMSDKRRRLSSQNKIFSQMINNFKK